MFMNCGTGEDSWESLDRKPIKPVNPKGNQPWRFIGRSVAEVLILKPLEGKNWLIGKDPDAGKIEGRRVRGRQRMKYLDSIVDSMDMSLGKLWEIVKDMVCCRPWGCKESDTTELLNNNTAQLEQIRNHIEKYQKPNCCFWDAQDNRRILGMIPEYSTTQCPPKSSF